MPPVDAAANVPGLVTVVIVNFNGGDVILRCLAALQRQQFRMFETIVVDNHSTDGSVAQIESQFPSVRVLRLETNLGFAGGVNHALRGHVHSPLLVLLNPDAFPEVEWLGNLVAAAEQCPEYAAFGSRMFSDPSMQHLDGVGDVYHISGIPWRQGHGQADSIRYNQRSEIFAPCAAAALYRTEPLRSIGCFDEDLFLYIEDVDVGFRLRLAGHRCLYVPEARVWHVGSAFVGKHSDFQIYHGHRNLVWVFLKNMPTALLMLLLPVHLALTVVSLLVFSAKGQARTIFRAKWDALRGIPHYWGKRKQTQGHRKASVMVIAQALRWNPFGRR